MARLTLARLAPPVPVALAVLAAATALLWWVVDSRLPLIGHDEAVYAAKGRSWVSTAPEAGWSVYRPVLLPVVSAAVHLAGGSLQALRVVALVFALFALGTLYVVGARVTTRGRALTAVAVVLAAPAFLRRLPEFLNDVLTAGLLLALCALIIRDVRDPSFVRRVGAAALVLLIFFTRYGALVSVTAVLAAALVVYGVRPWLRRPGGLVAALAVLLAGAVPFAWWSWQVTGSPLGVLLRAGDVAGPEYPGEGLVYYAARLPWAVSGAVGGVVMAVGVLYGGRAAWRFVRRGRPVQERDVDGALGFLAVAAVLQVLLLGLTAHGEPRFVFFAVMATSLVGVHAIAEMSGRFAGAALLVVLVATALAVPGRLSGITALVEEDTETRRLVAAAAAAARDAAEGGPCTVATSYQPQAGWYSRCSTAHIAQTLRDPLPPHAVSFLLVGRDAGRIAAADIEREVQPRQVEIQPVGGANEPQTVVTVLPQDD